MHGVIKIFIWLLVGYAAYLCFIFFAARHLIFPRSQIGYPPGHSNTVPNIEKKWLNISSGKVETWFLSPVSDPAAGPAPVVIFAHGNAELIDFAPLEFKPFTELGIGVLLVEYPGYGRSEGRPSQKSITETFIAAYDMLVSRRDVNPEKIILYGRSLGGGAVCTLAVRRPSRAMIMTSSFTSIRSMSARYLVPGFLVRDPFDNLAVVKNYAGSILIIHGKHDSIIPFRHGLTLYKAAPKGTLLAYDCGHNDCPPNPDIYWRDVASFLYRAGIIQNDKVDAITPAFSD